jgi:hypothetical protein
MRKKVDKQGKNSDNAVSGGDRAALLEQVQQQRKRIALMLEVETLYDRENAILQTCMYRLCTYVNHDHHQDTHIHVLFT